MISSAVKTLFKALKGVVGWVWGMDRDEKIVADMRRRIEENRPISVSAEPESCPRCGYHKITSFVYGLPATGPDGKLKGDMQQRIDRDEIALGGCVISHDSPKWLCKNCRARFVLCTGDL